MNSKVKYSKELLENIAKDCPSVAEVIRKLGLKKSGGNHSHISRRLKIYEIDTKHFLRVRTNSGARHVGGNSKLRRALIECGVEEKCEQCGIPPIWNGKPFVLEIDHRDGNGLNNLIGNLRFLCHICHSQTENYGAKNIS